jgi:molybdopterin-guanine dinucleotide biosynthesis protein A
MHAIAAKVPLVARPAGVILAGGRATRMGGGDKGLRAVAGARLLDRVIARLGPQCAALALNANGDPTRFAEFGLPVLPDSVADHPGPLAGVLAGLDWAADQGHEAIVTAAADTPFFPTDLVDRLAQAAGPSGLALAATRAGDRTHRQPTFGLWPVTLRDNLRAALGDGLRKIVLWTDRHGAGTAVFDADPIDPFFNVNTPEDLAEAATLAERA